MDARVDKGWRRRRWAGGALVLLVWWGVLGGLWMLLVDTVSIAEVSSAVAAALLGALAAYLAFEQQIAPLRLTVEMLAWLSRQLVRVPADLWLLALALAHALTGRRNPGRFHEIPVQLPDDPAGNTHRAGLELFGSLAPNTIVLGVDDQRAIVHQLAARHQERHRLQEIGS